jgi:hypothetical protein
MSCGVFVIMRSLQGADGRTSRSTLKSGLPLPAKTTAKTTAKAAAMVTARHPVLGGLGRLHRNAADHPAGRTRPISPLCPSGAATSPMITKDFPLIKGKSFLK